MAASEREAFSLLEDVVPTALFRAEVDAWARRLKVAPREIRLRPMRRKWASCSNRGRLTFDTALLRAEPRFRAEVIVHELLHLKVPVFSVASMAQSWRRLPAGNAARYLIP